jgi:hypothetical protein
MLELFGGVSAAAAAAGRNAILRALDQRRSIRIMCVGGEVHILQPHAIVRKPDGSELLQAYRTPAGASDRGGHGWRHLDLLSVLEVGLLTERFVARRDFQPVSGASGMIVAQVHGSGPVTSR